MTRIKELRHAAGLTMAQVAKALGISTVFVSNIEGGISPLPSKHTAAWALVLGVPADELTCYEAVDISLTGLHRAEREKVAAFVAELRASRAA